MIKQPETVLVATVGITPEPILKAMTDAHEEGSLKLFLVYGRAFPGQEPTPFSISNTISKKAKELGVPVRVFELDDPENLSHASQLFQQVIAEASEISPDRILLDFTGGTKVMAASMVHVALSQQWGTDIVFQYVGGPRDQNGKVTDMSIQRSPETALQELVSNIMGCLRDREYTRAMYSSAWLPKRDKFGFLKKAAHIMWHWDNFHYNEAISLIQECRGQANVLTGDAQYSLLADTIVRLNRVTERVHLAIVALEELQQGSGVEIKRGAAEGWVYILGDTIANARRKVISSPIDSVLRSYRAIEVATQLTLTRLKVNPWKPDWEHLPEEQFLATAEDKNPPRQLSLWNGVKLLEVISSPLLPKQIDDLRDIMTARNFSYLEHGYSTVSKETAQKILTKMERVVIAITAKAGLDAKPLECAEELRLEA